jgi:hypothetical protein
MKLHLLSKKIFLFGGLILVTTCISLFGFRNSEENIFVPDALAGYGVNDIDIFTDYQSWVSSDTFSADDKTAQPIYLLAAQNNNASTLSDINGDGLADIIYHRRFSSNGYIDHQIAVLLNMGGYEFDLVYKCAITSPTASNEITYYGDCADTSS